MQGRVLAGGREGCQVVGAQKVGSGEQRGDTVCQREGCGRLLERGGESEGGTERRGGRVRWTESQKWVERRSEGGRKAESGHMGV